MKPKNTARQFIFSILILILILFLSIAVGSVFISPANQLTIFFSKFSGQPIEEKGLQSFATIIFSLRFPRTILIALTGAALAGSGAAYQGLFRNPLADPYLIGVASGAGLGAVIAMGFKWPYTTIGFLAIPLAAFSGSILTVFLVYQLARIKDSLPTTNLILAGVAISSFATSLSSFIMLNANNELRRAISWHLGGSTLSGWQPVIAVFPYILLGLGLILTTGHALNVLQFGDEQAQQLGLNVKRVRFLVITSASLTTAAAVAFSGIIGFVGLIVPHLVRMLWSSDYKKLIPLSILNGASMLLAADILSRVVLAPQEVPVGIITSLAGAPFFLWILKRSRNQNLW